MTRLLIKKCLWDSALLLSACTLMLFTFAWARIWILCQFDLQKFEPLLKQFEAFERFSPVPLDQFLTFAGAIGMTFNEPVLILCIVVWSVARGSDVVSGELSRGTLEMLLAQPISRTRWLITHAAVCTAGLALLSLVVWFGLYLGIQTNSVEESMQSSIELRLPLLPAPIPIPAGPATEVTVPLAAKVSPALYVTPTINLFAFGFFLLSLSSMCSAMDRYRWRTIGLVIGFYVLELLVFLLSRATESTRWLGNFTFFSLYQPDGMVHVVRNRPGSQWEFLSASTMPGWDYTLGPLGMNLLLLLLGSAFYGVAWYTFKRRDLPAPL